MNPQAGRAASFTWPPSILFSLSFRRKNSLFSPSLLLWIDMGLGMGRFIGRHVLHGKYCPGERARDLLEPFTFPRGLREAGRKGRRLEKMNLGSLAILLDASTVGV